MPHFPWWAWAILAAVVGIAELHVPGSYLIWIASGIAITAAAEALFGLTFAQQIAVFAVASCASCILGYFVYRGFPTKRVIGKNTTEAIQSGIYWGYTGLIEGTIARIKKEFGAPMTVIATGGLARLFSGAVESIEHFDDGLTLRGLQKIDARNRKA